MKNFVRIIGLILLLVSTTLFVLKIKYVIPVENLHLVILFIVGAACYFWANLRNKPKDERIHRF
jgi:hypothetical protein